MLKFIDETMRDGPQSLWATRMDTRTMLEASPLINKAGFDRATVISGASFETAVRFLSDDPWERMRLVRSYLPDTNIDVLIRSRNLFGWNRYPDEVVKLLFHCLQRNGTKSIKVFDGLNDVSNIAAHCRIGKQLGLQVTGMITYSKSPIHTDEHYAQKAREYLDLGVDGIVVADASGILDGPQTVMLLAAINRGAANRIPIEFYAHASMGLAHESYRAALKAGVSAVTTAAEPLANGESLPATNDIVRIASELGIAVPLDMDAVRRLDDYMYWAAYREGKQVFPLATFDPVTYDRFVEHQIPGGMISNFRNQLKEAGLMHRLDEVLHEAGRVRAELGYPIMVTPFSQFVGVQATLNIIQGERYKTIPNEVRLFALGYYGSTGAPIDPNVLDRILNGNSADRIVLKDFYEERVLDDFRQQNGPFRSDEELLLHLFYGRPTVEAMEKNKNVFMRGNAIKTPLKILVEELTQQTAIKTLRIEKRNGVGNRGPLRIAMDYA